MFQVVPVHDGLVRRPEVTSVTGTCRKRTRTDWRQASSTRPRRLRAVDGADYE